MEIYNCHIHTFTIKHVPDAFYSRLLDRLIRNGFLRRPIVFLLRFLNPFNDRDMLDRLANFLEISANCGQDEVFQKAAGYYPPDTRFVVLPMDMAHMHAGTVHTDLECQHAELEELRRALPPEKVIPFVAADANHVGVDAFVTKWIEQHDFKGIKIYPPLGYYPFDPRLAPVYECAIRNNVPVMAHCSRGGVYNKRKITPQMLTHPRSGVRLSKKPPKDFTDYYTDPSNYRYVFEDFPELRICLAHFGGGAEWAAYLENEWHTDSPPEEQSWLSVIMDMIKGEGCLGLYTDISYTIFENEGYMEVLDVLLEDERLLDRVLLGSDFYMVEMEKLKERRVMMKLRSTLGERKFWKIAHENPKRFLG